MSAITTKKYIHRATVTLAGVKAGDRGSRLWIIPISESFPSVHHALGALWTGCRPSRLHAPLHPHTPLNYICTNAHIHTVFMLAYILHNLNLLPIHRLIITFMHFKKGLGTLFFKIILLSRRSTLNNIMTKNFLYVTVRRWKPKF
jgi:hypothetical protein